MLQHVTLFCFICSTPCFTNDFEWPVLVYSPSWITKSFSEEFDWKFAAFTVFVDFSKHHVNMVRLIWLVDKGFSFFILRYIFSLFSSFFFLIFILVYYFNQLVFISVSAIFVA